MSDLTDHEQMTVDGGLDCWGYWVGTKDMKYGFCFGYSEN